MFVSTVTLYLRLAISYVRDRRMNEVTEFRRRLSKFARVEAFMYHMYLLR
jgi:hypothetical protein